MWQTLYSELADQGFSIVTVALDVPDAARRWIEAANPTYPCLIDRYHHVAALFNFTNVPQAVWIDEDGRIVRPPENAGQSDAFRRMNRTTGQMTADQTAERARVKALYIDAVRDWVANGSRSRHVYTAETARARLRLPDAGIAAAHVHLTLAQILLRPEHVSDARRQEAARHFARASTLHPNSWAIFRQGAMKDATGAAAGPDFWARVDALGAKPYHLPIDMEGLKS